MILTSGCCVGLAAVTPGPGAVPVTRVGSAATRGTRGSGVLATADLGLQAAPVGSPLPLFRYFATILDKCGIGF